MPFISHRLKLIYFPIPKVACTSLKHAVFRMDTGRDYVPLEVGGKSLHIHKLINARPVSTVPLYYQAYFSFAVVRDPVDRLISAYWDKIVATRKHAGEPIQKRIAARRLPTEPTLAEFVDNFAAYRDLVPSIRHHTRPQADFLPDGLNDVKLMVSFENLATLPDRIRERSGLAMTLEHHHQRSRDPEHGLTRHQITAIRSLYSRDCEVLDFCREQERAGRPSAAETQPSAAP